MCETILLGIIIGVLVVVVLELWSGVPQGVSDRKRLGQDENVEQPCQTLNQHSEKD